MRLFSLMMLIFTLGLSGCVSNPYQGNFSSYANQTNYQSIIDDAVLQIATIYIPAQTTFHFAKPKDDFGLELISRLRESGFAIDESSKVESENNQKEFQYIFDDISGLQLQRLILTIDNHKLTRAYRFTHGNFSPAGSWLRQEMVNE